ncbi:GAPR1 protein, partial [Polypterus senegalus]
MDVDDSSPVHIEEEMPAAHRIREPLRSHYHATPMGPSKQFAEEVLKAHNEKRKNHGVPTLTLSSKLNREAQQWSGSSKLSLCELGVFEWVGFAENLSLVQGLPPSAAEICTKPPHKS